MRTAMRLVATVDWLCALWAMVEWRRLSAFNPQTSPDMGVMAVFALWLMVIVLLGLASGGGLMVLARSSDPKKWGAPSIAVGSLAPALLLLFAAR
jgi:hypothetical protein